MNEKTSKAQLVDYLRLVRAPNVFTSVGDVTMGYLLVQRTLEPIVSWVCLVVASSLFYMAGMVLNDVFDIEKDRKERPERPLPSGRISLAQARAMGFAFLAGGLCLGSLATWTQPQEGAIIWRGAVVSAALAACILLYDGVLKKTPVAPLFMGGCRFFNILLGMCGAVLLESKTPFLSYAPHELLAAGGIGVYIAGVTWFARNEAHQNDRLPLIASTIVMCAGLAMLCLIYQYLPPGFLPHLGRETSWFLLLGLLGFTIVRRCGIAIADPQPKQIQVAVKHAILSLVVLDAAVAFLASGPIYAIGVLLLLLPILVLGQWIYST